MFPTRGIGCLLASLVALRVLLATLVSAQTTDNPPLHAAALRNDADAVEKLLDAGADANALNVAGASALHYSTGSERIVKALLARGAKVDVIPKRISRRS
jgi:ankyrin repeat protein